jgi:hypothetical protein
VENNRHRSLGRRLGERCTAQWPGEVIWGNSKLLLVIASILPLTLMLSGAFLYWRGGQYTAQASAESVITDANPHLLYLRPFRSDSTFAKGLFRAIETTEEEQLADVLRPFGALVAIGRPGARACRRRARRASILPMRNGETWSNDRCRQVDSS